LAGRRKQTIIVAAGMALAIALVIVVNAVSAGVTSAQAQVLQSVYGVGTDITVTQPATAASGNQDRPRFDFGANDGSESSDGSRTVKSSRLSTGPGTQTLSASALKKVAKTANVSAAAAVLSLTNTTFDGTLPDFSQLRGNAQSGGQAGGQGDGSVPNPAPTGGADGAGGSSFNVDSFSVLGVDPTGDAAGPLSATTLTKGRSLAAKDAGKEVVVLDASYAKTASLTVGDTTTIGGKDFSVIGIVSPTGSDATTASNAYIPLDTAQSLSGESGKVTTIYVSADSSSDIAGVKAAIQKLLPDATVSTQAELASTVSGSLGSAGELLSNLGTSLSVIVLAAAFLIAILFTISGVTRRTREFGTLKAIGWSNRRIVGQVAGESVVQGVIGGIVGVAVGLVAVLIVNVVAPTLSGGVAATTSRAFAGAPAGAAQGAAGGQNGVASTAAPTAAPGFGAASGSGGGFDRASSAASSASDIALHAPVTVWIIAIAVGLAVLGGLLAGAIGGWRASRLRPAEALRSVA
jgi:ABC-type antimicrobial peptide transport system permease subunit